MRNVDKKDKTDKGDKRAPAVIYLGALLVDPSYSLFPSYPRFALFISR